MKRIGDSTGTADGNGEWTEGSPAAGVAATLIKADWLNTIQRELINLLLAAEIAINVNDDAQVLKAVRELQSKALQTSKQFSPYDGTDGRILTPGAFGWGSTYEAGPMLLTDILGDQIKYSGLYRYSPATVGKPSFGSGYGSILQSSLINDRTGNWATQLVIDYAADAIGFRRLSGDKGWQEFKEIYHVGNLGGATTAKAGLVKLASDELVEAGTDDASAVSPLTLKRKMQASLYDPTAGKLLSPGSFGWGSTYSNSPMLLTNILGDQIKYSGLYRYSPTTVGRPSFGSGYGSILQSSLSNDAAGNWATQLVIDYAADAIGFRRLSGDKGWQDFREIYHNGNLGVATTVKAGLMKVASDDLVETGTDDATAISPLRLKRKMQSSLYDPTEGKLLSPGSFGWGSTYSNGPLLLTDILGDQIKYSGLYRYSPATAGRPSFGSGYGSILQSSLSHDTAGNWATQLVIDYAADAIGFRRLSGDKGWQDFREIYHTGNLGGASTVKAGLIKVTSDDLVETGTDDTTAISPLRLKRKMQSDPYDPTEGKLLSPGSFGWGSTYGNGPRLLTNISGDQVRYSGLYRYDSSTVDKPSFGSGFGSLLQSSLIGGAAGNFATQFVIDYASDAIGFRRLTGQGGWQSFKEIYHTGNLGRASIGGVGLAQIASVADVLAGVSNDLVPSVATLIAGVLGAGGDGTTDYLMIPYKDKTTGARKNLVLQWTLTPALVNTTNYVWTFPVALTKGVLFAGGMSIGTTSGTIQTPARTLTSMTLSNGTANANANPAFVFVVGV